MAVLSHRAARALIVVTAAPLSRRGHGEPEGSQAGSAVSNLKSHLVLRDGVANFTGLSFAVPGASVQLSGSYGLDSEQLDFRGKLLLAAPLSKTTTGVKSFFLKLVEPFLKGTAAPCSPSASRARGSIPPSGWMCCERL